MSDRTSGVMPRSAQKNAMSSSATSSLRAYPALVPRPVGQLMGKRRGVALGVAEGLDWCMGFVAATRLRYDAWRPLRDISRIEHGLLLPILLHCTDSAGRPVLGPVRPGPEGQEFLRTAYHDIPLVIPAIREFWMPQRARS